MDEASGSNNQNPFSKRPMATGSSGSKRRRRTVADEGKGHYDIDFSGCWRYDIEQNRNISLSKAIDNADPLAINHALEELDSQKYGSVTKEVNELVRRRMEILQTFYADNPELASADFLNCEIPLEVTEQASPDVIDIEDGHDGTSFARFLPIPQQSLCKETIVVIDSDEERSPCKEVNLQKPSGNFLMKDFVKSNFNNKGPGPGVVYEHIALESQPIGQSGQVSEANSDGSDEETQEESDEVSETHSDGLADIWNEMNVVLECSKDATADSLLDEYNGEDEEDCEHSFILKDDIGDVCRICGVIKRGIESIIEYNFSKSTKNTRTYSRYEARTSGELAPTELPLDGFRSSDSVLAAADIYPHPRHRKEMKSHQLQGFNFLVSNLVTDNPGGCIMAHAPGSGKTFMIISFLQSFMAKYPAARPLVVLPKGILAIWKKEFLRWQVEDFPLYDFYSVKAESRLQQLEVLKGWVKERSILFLGYKQFSTVICDGDDGQAAVACQNYLLKVPTILILDEGHTPRNQDTDVLTSLERVETPRKVVLSGTLYQNHVEEVFNILNLVRPKFLKMETSKAIKRRILSRAEISYKKKLSSSNRGREHQFYELIEHTLTKDENSKRKVTVIQDLREMTRNILHYYKGDNLDELPGLVDFSVFLNLSHSQRSEVKELTRGSARKFTVSAQGSAIYLHPKLKTLAKQCGAKDRVDEEKINGLLENLSVSEGSKLNFYLNLLQLCESGGEKLLVFSQYLLPLKFLEISTAKLKGYSVGKEMFMITGDSDSDTREHYMEMFNTSSCARVFFGSIRACGEGISLVGASRLIILDVHLNPSVTRQAIGRVFRPGQKRKVYTYRLIARDSPEEEDHWTCFRKESIAKMWFEWDESSSRQNLEMEKVDVNSCGDTFLETSRLNKDVIDLFKSLPCDLFKR